MSWKESHICDGCDKYAPMCNKSCERIKKADEKRAKIREAKIKQELINGWTVPEKFRKEKSLTTINHENKTRGLY